MRLRARIRSLRLVGRLGAGLGVAPLLAMGAVGLRAQELPLKRPAVSSGADCPAHAGGPTQRLSTPAVDSLLAAGSQAAILGDFSAAEDYLRRAAQLDGSNPVVAYRLARTLDDQGKLEPAAHEYCRYLALAPRAADAAEVQGRVRSLVASGSVSLGDPAEAQLFSAVEAFDAGRYSEAIDRLTRAIALDPARADAHYNRAVANLAAGRPDDAAADLDAYLRLAHQPADGPAVRTRLDRLRAQSIGVAAASPPQPAAAPRRRAVAAPGSALVQGLVVPGLGQHATGRTALGLGVLAGVGGAVYLAVHPTVVVRQMDAQDPFGNPYQYDVRVREHPYQAIGIGAAVALGLGAAVESFLYARHERSAQESAVASSSLLAHPNPRLWVAPGEEGGVLIALRFGGALP